MLCINNYGRLGCRAAWEVDHSKAQANGGTHHGNNLLAACIECNRRKRDGCSNAFRKAQGLTQRPWSTGKRDRARTENAIGGGAICALIGAAGGPVGILAGSIIGIFIGHNVDPEE
jgi:hypothetical protein